jgi:selenocysteine lyase/cysteine desulfurase
MGRGLDRTHVDVDVIRHCAKPGGLIAGLERAKVHASARGRWLRVTPHLYNSPEDVDRLLHTLVKGSR